MFCRANNLILHFAVGKLITSALLIQITIRDLHVAFMSTTILIFGKPRKQSWNDTFVEKTKTFKEV